MSNPVNTLNDSATATIASGASLSGAVNLIGRALSGIQMPAAWTAADLSFQVSFDNVTYFDFHDTAGEVTFPAEASIVVGLNPAIWIGVQYLKVRSGASAAPVNQGAERDIVLILSDLTR